MDRLTSPEVHWILPEDVPPPSGVEMHLLTIHGVMVRGSWSDSGFYVAYCPFPKRSAAVKAAMEKAWEKFYGS